uniref:Acidic endochitinase n=1 Tax=Cajanus platycarpus TaxID=2094123 RepID=A0A6G7NNW0_9FABA|nr:hevamine-A-like protein [Cajanus platycarpus]
MAYKMQALVIFLLSLFTFSSSSPDNSNGGIAVYWGQNNGDGDLITTCDTNKYKIVLLAFLNKFGGGRTPAWNFAGHCDNGAWKKCYELEPEIKHCQAKGIKVLLSIGGAPEFSDYSISSVEDAKIVANYLYTNFLSGQFGPLGSVTLDGIDFDIEVTEDHWDDLARELDTLRRTKGPYFHLSAAPQCPIPVYFLGKAIATGLFDYLLVQFYNNPDCSYTGGSVKPVLDSWDKWVNLVQPNNTLFLGLPAAPSAAWIGYIEPEKLIREVLPHVKLAPNYGGVMLWDRFRDVQNDYSGQILPYVSKLALLSMTSLSNAIYECVSNAFHRLLTLSPYAAN